jgi:hypothetical protein
MRRWLRALLGKQTAQNLVLTDGMPDEPDTGDWDAICKQPSIEGFFATLFRDVAHKALPGLCDQTVEEDDEARVRTGCYGDSNFGVDVKTVQILESTMFDLRCRWETHGLPGMTVIWDYSLEYAGQLGHTAYRHTKLECRFDSDADQKKFAQVWLKAIGKAPRFAPA